MVQVFAVASAKGGVGKTTTTANIGAILAETGADVVVLDGDISMPNLGAALGIESPSTTIHDVLRGDATPAEATYEGPGGVYVVPGDTALSSYASADPEELPSVLRAHSQADYILIDVGAGVSHETGLPLSLADDVLLVSTPERDALRDTDKTRQLTEELGGTVAGAVITRTTPSTPVSELATGTLAAPVLGSIPEDEAVRDSVAVGEPLSTYAPHSPAAAAYRELVAELTGVEPAAPSESGSPSTAQPDTTPDREPADSDAEPTDTPAEPTTAADVDAGLTDNTSVSEDEAKWAEAATGTGGDVDKAVAEEAASLPGGSASSPTSPESPNEAATPTPTDDADTDPGLSESTTDTDDEEPGSSLLETAEQTESVGSPAAVDDDSMTPEPTTETITDEAVDEDTASPVADVADEIAAESAPVDAETAGIPAEPAPPDPAAEPAVDEKPSDAAVPFSDTTAATEPADDEPLIPNAEDESSPTADDDPTTPTELGSLPAESASNDESDESDDDDDEEGFFRRLFFS